MYAATREQKVISKMFSYLLLALFGVLMVYPLVWMVFACFKSNAEILGTQALLPTSWSFEAFRKGWLGVGQYTFGTYLLNSVFITLPSVFFTVLSSAVVAFGFARFRFPGKKIFFAVMISTLMLPNTVIIIPRYLLFNGFGWLNTFKPFIVPTILATDAYFVFMIVQFLRGIPKELDEAAYIDGCGSLRLFFTILLPLMKPALFSAGLFQFMWSWNDFYNPLIYLNSVSRFPISLGLRISLDAASTVAWNQIMAMALVSILPVVLLFFFAQRYFVEGIATSGIKG